MTQITTVTGTLNYISPCDPVEMDLIRWRREYYCRPMNRAASITDDIHGPIIVLVTEFMGGVLRHNINRRYRFTGYWDEEDRFCSILAEPTKD